MPSVNSNTYIKEMRQRKKMLQLQLLRQKALGNATVSRVENKRQTPNTKTYENFMDKMEMSVDTVYCPFLENQTLDVFQIRRHLLYLIEQAEHHPVAIKQADDLLQELKNKKGFETGINKQFIIRCQSHLALIQNHDPKEILKLTREGICLTYPEFNPKTFRGDILLYNEARLIHTQALAYEKNGELTKAIELLKRVQMGLSRLPQDDKDKEKHLAPILLDLARLLINAKEYNQALKIYETGNNPITRTRTKGKYTTDFMFIKAKALQGLGVVGHDIKPLLVSVYFGFILMRNPVKAQSVMDYAQNIGITFQTYGVENLPMLLPDAAFDRGYPVPCENFGTFIRGLRNQTNQTQRQLCEGICDIHVLSRIERNKSKFYTGDVYILEALMQRMGRDIDEYFITLMSNDDFEEKQIRDKVYTLVASKLYHEAEPLLVDLEKRKAYQNGVNHQFVKSCRATLYRAKNGYDDNFIKMLEEAWMVTRRRLNDNDIDEMRLTFYEIVILNNMALYYGKTGNRERGIGIWEKLLKNIERHYVDESERIRTYLTTMYNYSKYLGLHNRRIKAIKITVDGDELSIKHGDLWHASQFATNRAVSMHRMGMKEKGIPLFALAYYGSILMDRTDDQKAIREYAKEHLDIVFD